MTTDEIRRGGLEVWAPSVVPPIGVDLTDEQTLACAFRILAGRGFTENMAGHITWQRRGTDRHAGQPVGPVVGGDHRLRHLRRRRVTAAVLDGQWDVTPAIHIHTELHRRRPDARVVVHNHPYYVTVLAAVGVLPEIVHQTGCMFDGDLDFVDEYTGEVDDAELGARPGRADRRRARR